jgi:P pilus assembly chaperone PapD
MDKLSWIEHILLLLVVLFLMSASAGLVVWAIRSLYLFIV